MSAKTRDATGIANFCWIMNRWLLPGSWFFSPATILASNSAIVISVTVLAGETCLKTEDGSNRNTIEIKARRIQFLNRREAHHDEVLYEHEHQLETEHSNGHLPEDHLHEHAEELLKPAEIDFSLRAAKL